MKIGISPPLVMMGEPSQSGYLPMEVGAITIVPIAPGAGSVSAIDHDTGAELWRRENLGPPLAVWRDGFVTWAPSKTIALVNAKTGFVELMPDIPFGLSLEAKDGLVTGTRNEDGRSIVFCGDLVRGREAWRWSRGESQVVSNPVRSATMTHFGTTNEVVALQTVGGSEAWRDDVADLTHEESLETRPGSPAGKGVVIDETIIFHLVRDWTVGYCVRTGRRKWTHRSLGGTQASTAHDGRYHALMSQDYVALNPETGAELRRVRLDSALPATKKMFLGPPILVTSEHVWLGSQRGFVFAFTREGNYVWSFRPKGAAWSGHGAFAILGRRLYYSDGHRTYCFEEKPRKAAGPSSDMSSAVKRN